MNDFYNSFYNDLRIGHIAENMFKQILLQSGITGVTINNSTDIEQLRRYDLEFYNFNSSKPIRIEVKADHKALETNNICIECKYDHNDSGIRTTASMYYAILVDTIYYVISTKKLKELCDSRMYQLITLSHCNTVCYMIPLAVIARQSKQVNINNYL